MERAQGMGASQLEVGRGYGHDVRRKMGTSKYTNYVL